MSMKRTGFKRATIERKPRLPVVPRTEPAHAILRRLDGKSRMSVPVPKGVKTKPGKRAPTVEEARWMSAIVEYGCIACRLDGMAPRQTAVHHILSGGRRMGHLYTIGLCDPGHHQGGQSIGLVSRHPWKARFEEKYGPESDLLNETVEELTQRGLWPATPKD